MIKWEYKTVFNDTQVTDDSVTKFLNAEGLEGWELVNILYLFGTFQAIFKRQLEKSYTYSEYKENVGGVDIYYDGKKRIVGWDTSKSKDDTNIVVVTCDKCKNSCVGCDPSCCGDTK